MEAVGDEYQEILQGDEHVQEHGTHGKVVYNSGSKNDVIFIHCDTIQLSFFQAYYFQNILYL
jgi:hypothetical protein